MQRNRKTTEKQLMNISYLEEFFTITRFSVAVKAIDQEQG